MLNQTQTTDTLRLIRCDIGDETYGLDMFWVRSIQRTDRLGRNPEGHGPSTGRRGEPVEPSGHGPSTGRRGEPVEPSGHGPVGWVSGSEGDIPVFSLASRLGRPSKEGGALQRIIVLNPPPFPLQAGESEELLQAEGEELQARESESGRPWALLVDRVSQVIQVPAERVVPMPPIVVNPAADYFQGVIKLGEELILLLAPERLRPLSSLPQAGGSERRPQAGGSKGEAREAASPSLVPIPTTGLPTASVGGRRRGLGRMVIFSIAEPHPTERALSFGLSISQVPEILDPLPMIPVPAAAAFVLGLVNWRDRPVPVIDLASRLGLAPEAAPSANGRIRLIIARDKVHLLRSSEDHTLPVSSPIKGRLSKGGPNQGALVGFPVQPAIQVLRLPIAHQPSSRILPLDQTLTRGIVELENATLVIPDIRGILWPDG